MKFTIVVGIALFAGTWFFLENLRREFEDFTRRAEQSISSEEEIFSLGETSTF